MKFVYPEFLWALSLLIVPIIIHLFSFRKYKTLYFSSLQFIHHIEKQNKSTQKLKNLLILIARLLALAFIVIAFAQPYFPSSSNTQKNSSTIMCIHIDNSFSMTMKGVEGELLSEAKESARSLINKAPLNTKIMLSTNALEGIEAHITTKIEALERLDKIEPSPMIRSFDEVIKWEKDNLKKNTQVENFAQVQFVYLSDFQKNTTHFNLLEPDSTNRYVPIRFVYQNQSNLSIDSVWFDSPLHKTNVINELYIKATNHGQEDLQNVQLQFESSEINRDLFVDIPKGQSVITSLSFSPKKVGIQSGVIKIADKQFYSDDDYFFTYTVAEKSPILVIDGTDANKNLANIYKLDNFYSVNEVEQGSFIQSMLLDVNLVVLNGVNELSSGLSANLANYNQNGGTVSIFLGKSIEKNSINSFLSKLELPLVVKEIAQSTRINKISYKDLFFKGVFDKERENLNLPGVTKFYLTDESKGSNAISIIQLQNGKSLFYRTGKKQQSFLFTSVLQPEYGTFTSDILYTTLILRIGELSLKNTPLSVMLGKASNYPIYTEIDQDRPVILKGNKIEFIPAKHMVGNVTYIDLSGSEAISNLKAGIYSIESNGIILSKVAINYNREESNIDLWSEDEINNSLKNAGILHSKMINVDKGASSVNLNIEKPYPYWKFFVSFALLFLLSEILILKLWKNKIEN